MSLLTLSLFLIPIGLLTSYILTYLRSPLKEVPGPFLAKFSDLWRFFNHYSRSHIETQKALHEKYGDTVRLGPNVVSVTDPALVKKIYEIRGTYVKSEYYSINDALQGGHIIPNLFSTRSNEFHSRALKPVQKLYSHQSALQFESLMDDNVRAWCSELEIRYMTGENKGRTCDIAEWISFLAYDFLGDITFSKRLGFIEAGKDVGNMIKSAEQVMGYFSVVGQIPQLDKFLGKNPYASYIPYKFADFAVPATFCVQRFMERVQNPGEYKEKRDFMNGFLAAKEEYPDLVTDNDVIGYMMLNILGGADTTAILLKALVYHTLKNPSAQKTLVAELRTARSKSGIPSSVPLPHSLYSTLPYLQACIAEALRFHPVVGHILERIVPASGLTLANGTTLPPGTIVGINPWILTRNEQVYGERAEEFLPDRWLKKDSESDVQFEERVGVMKDADLAWGGGRRTCLGRPLALVELGKVGAALFEGYDVELEDPSQEWELHKQWFVWPHNIRVKMTKV